MEEGVMEKDYKEISLIKFQEKFQTEEDCQKRLVELRWPDGFICPRCKGRDYYDLPKRHLYQCKGCGYQVSITSGNRDAWDKNLFSEMVLGNLSYEYG